VLVELRQFHAGHGRDPPPPFVTRARLYSEHPARAGLISPYLARGAEV
jgi:hypothetical protein